jgi:hypothetical protein
MLLVPPATELVPPADEVDMVVDLHPTSNAVTMKTSGIILRILLFLGYCLVKFSCSCG